MSVNLYERVLVDTCIWIEFFRKDSATTRALTDVIQSGRAVLAGVIIYELTQGIRSNKERSTIRHLLAGLDYKEMTPDLWEAAGDLAQGLKQRGQTLPMSDILIAAIAIKYKLSLFTIDAHFDSIPDVKRYIPGE